MKYFRVYFKTSVSGMATVSAESEEEAEMKAEKLEAKNIDWNNPEEDGMPIFCHAEEETE